MVRAANRLFLGQALADNALDGLDGAFPVLYAQRGPFVVPEVEFAQIPLQVRRADVVINAVDPTLEDR